MSLSGGQQQRIAIRPCHLSMNRKCFFSTSPLGALDLKMRQDMQYELIRLKNELGITFVYVTHDQEEALTMSDTIVVMNGGYIQQIGTPEDIYNEPQNAFVADFIGDSNLLGGTMIQDRLVEILGAKFLCVDEGFGTNNPVDVVIRPEDVELVKPEVGIIKGRVTSVIFKGVHYEMTVLANNFEWLVHSTDMYPADSEVGIFVNRSIFRSCINRNLRIERRWILMNSSKKTWFCLSLYSVDHRIYPDPAGTGSLLRLYRRRRWFYSGKCSRHYRTCTSEVSVDFS